MNRFRQTGWCKLPFDQKVLDWVMHVKPAAMQTLEDKALRRDWLRAGGTWFVGVNALPNDGAGRLNGGPPLTGTAMAFIRDALGMGDLALDRAQVSAVLPGYPVQDAGESDAAFRFRTRRDGAHVDGVKRFAADGARHIGECHGYLLGVPLNTADEGASPLAVWEGSHEVMRAGLGAALQGIAASEMSQTDITQAYTSTRRKVFETCERRLIHARPGEAYLLHRLTLHGISPWQDGATAPEEGRMIAYFRPAMPGGVAGWLSQP